MLELLTGVLLAVAALAVVLEPLFRHSSWEPVLERGISGGEEDPLEAESPKLRALVALREIEFDKATGKLSDEDYLRLKAKYEREALAAIAAEERTGTVEKRVSAGQHSPVECPTCGPRPEAAPVFCSNCGRPLVAARVA